MLMLLFHVDETRDALANSQPSRLNQETSRLGFMKAFRVDGQAPFGRLRQKFSLDVVASSKADAEHRVYSIIGSRHKATRRAINIDSVSEIDPEHLSNQAFFTTSVRKSQLLVAPLLQWLKKSDCAIAAFMKVAP